MFRDVGAAVGRDRSDLNDRNADGHVVWGPTRTADPTWRMIAEEVAPFAAERPVPPKATVAQKRAFVAAIFRAKAA